MISYSSAKQPNRNMNSVGENKQEEWRDVKSRKSKEEKCLWGDMGVHMFLVTSKLLI